MSRTRNIIKIMYSNIMLQLITVTCGLILPPLMIEEYGSEVNGLISTIRQLLTYFSIVSLGLGAASSVALYKPLYEKNYQKVSEILSATKIFFNRTGYIFTVLVTITSFILPIFSKIDNLSFLQIALLIFVCGIGSTSEYITISKYKVLLTADQRLYILAKIQSQGVLLNTIFSVILIKLHMSIVIVQIVATLIYLLRLLLTIKYVRRNYKEVSFNVTPDFEAIDNRWDAFSYQVSDMIITYTPMLLIALFCGYNQASIYSIYNMIFMSVSMLVGIFFSGFSASFGNLIVSKNSNVLNENFKIYEYIFNIVLFTAYTSALVLVLPFIHVYIKNSDGVNYINQTIAILFSFAGVFKLLRMPSVIIVEASGDFKQNKKANIYEAIFNTALSLLLVFRYGISGILISCCLTAIIRSLLYISYSSKYILRNIYLIRYIKIVINLIIMIFLAYLWISRIPLASSYLQWFKYAIIIGISNLFVFILINSFMSMDILRKIAIKIFYLTEQMLDKKQSVKFTK